MRKAWFLPLAAIILVPACQKDDLLAPQTTARAQASLMNEGAATVSMMTQNVYIGFDADAAIAALIGGDPGQIAPVMATSIAQLQRTNFPLRAAAIVDEIARARPHAVGFQEVYRIQINLAVLGGEGEVDLDYLAILQAAFAARQLPYALVDTVMDMDARPLPGISIVDREALFVDTSRVHVNPGVIATQFQANIGVLAPGIDKRTGFIAAPVTIGGRLVTLVTTHLESDLGPESYPLVSQIRAAQAMEIAAAIGSGAAVVVGDMNDNTTSLMYGVFAGAGFTDLWQALRPGANGYTDTCFQPDLSDQLAHCAKRIDFVFARGLEQPQAGVLGSVSIVGILPSDRMTTPAGWLWPSDHAGLIGELLLPPVAGQAVN